MKTADTKVELVWTTENGEQLIGDMARVSAPENVGKDATGLMKYLIREHHWSPFEMVNACVKIDTTRDIARQLLRHRSFSFQEFSQRYASVDKLPLAPFREARLQDTKNRQNSLDVGDEELQQWWAEEQQRIDYAARYSYRQALDKGIAKEVARVLLPEGLTSSSMYMNGTLRSWIHFLQLRTGNGTQKETAIIARSVQEQLQQYYPNVWEALFT